MRLRWGDYGRDAGIRRTCSGHFYLLRLDTHTHTPHHADTKSARLYTKDGFDDNVNTMNTVSSSSSTDTDATVSSTYAGGDKTVFSLTNTTHEGHMGTGSRSRVPYKFVLGFIQSNPILNGAMMVGY